MENMVNRLPQEEMDRWNDVDDCKIVLSKKDMEIKTTNKLFGINDKKRYNKDMNMEDLV